MVSRNCYIININYNNYEVQIMTATTAKTVHAEIDAAVRAVLAKYGMQQKAGSKVTYGDAGLTYKIEVVELNENGSKKVGQQDIYDAEYEFMKAGYRISDETAKKLFTGSWNHPSIGTIHLEMVDTKKHKYPFIVKNTKGASYKLSAEQFIRIAGIETTKY